MPLSLLELKEEKKINSFACVICTYVQKNKNGGVLIYKNMAKTGLRCEASLSSIDFDLFLT